MSDETEYGLVMPFVCVESRGGPYGDDAFTAGYRCGLVDAALAAKPEKHHVTTEPALRAQLDLLAMRHGYVFVLGVDDEHWLQVTFWRKPAFGLFAEDELGIAESTCAACGHSSPHTCRRGECCTPGCGCDAAGPSPEGAPDE